MSTTPTPTGPQSPPEQGVDVADVLQALQARIGQMATEHAVGLATIAKLTAAAQVDREERSGLETRVAVAEMRAQQAAAELRSLRAAVATKEAAPVATADEPPADPIAG